MFVRVFFGSEFSKARSKKKVKMKSLKPQDSPDHDSRQHSGHPNRGIQLWNSFQGDPR